MRSTSGRPCTQCRYIQNQPFTT